MGSGSWKGNLAQYAGRLHREFEGKQDVQVYDYIDLRVPFCESMYIKRLKGYASVGYRIRNDKLLDSLSPTTDLIYDGLNFERPFISDLTMCKRSIVISCPKIRTNRYSQIAELLINLVSNGIEIVVYTKEENDDTIRLKQHGIDVIRNEHLSLHAAIIDKSLIWYGSVNILGYHSADDNLTELSHLQIACMILFIKNLRIRELMTKKRIIKNYPSQVTGILRNENVKWLAISSLIPLNSIIKRNSLIL